MRSVGAGRVDVARIDTLVGGRGWLAKQLPHNLPFCIHLGGHIGLQGEAILDVRISRTSRVQSCSRPHGLGFEPAETRHERQAVGMIYISIMIGRLAKLLLLSFSKRQRDPAIRACSCSCDKNRQLSSDFHC